MIMMCDCEVYEVDSYKNLGSVIWKNEEEFTSRYMGMSCFTLLLLSYSILLSMQRFVTSATVRYHSNNVKIQRSLAHI